MIHLTLVIQKIEQITPDTELFTLREKENRIEEFDPGQFLTIFFDVDGKKKKRGYSICSSPYELPEIRIAIKDCGGQTSDPVKNLKVGDELEALPPLGNFRVFPNKAKTRDLYMFAAGSGITPIFSMIQSVLNIEDESRVFLLYGNRSDNSIIFRKELDKLAVQFPDRFTVKYYITAPTEKWNGEKGRITKENVTGFLTNPETKPFDNPHFFICGPEGMMNSVIGALKELKYDDDRIHREIFQVDVLDKKTEIEEIPREVTLVHKGEKHIIRVDPGETILDKAIESGIELPHSCEKGNCGTCKAELLSGKIKLLNNKALKSDDPEDHKCLVCVGYPASDDVVIYYV